MAKKLKKLSLVKTKKNIASDKDNTFCYLGEIPNMQGHGVFIGVQSEKTYIGLHIENFKALKYGEV